MSKVASQLPRSVRSYIDAFIRRRRAVRLLRSLGIALAVLMGVGLAACLIDRFTQLHRSWRATALSVDVTLATTVLLQGIWLMSGRVSALDAAEHIERLGGQFGEQLQTVTSQLLAPEKYRGSEQLLSCMLDKVAAQSSKGSVRQLVPWRLAMWPWMVAMGVAAVTALLWPVGWLDLPRLVSRFVHPFARIAPVAVAQIDIEPKDKDVAQGESVTIQAHTIRADGHAPVLFLSNDGKSWSHVTMSALSQKPAPKISPATTRSTTPVTATPAQNIYLFPLPAIERDLQYYVEAGDAKTEIYQIRTKRVPAAAEFRIRYSLPAYTGHAPVVVTNLDGRLEAIKDSTAEVTIVSTEPLSSAELVLADGQRLPTFGTANPHERLCWVEIQRETPYRLEMVSTSGVEGQGPIGARIVAVTDRSPRVRILQPPDDLRLDPEGVIALRYEAADDYGVVSLEAIVTINTSKLAAFPVPMSGPPNRREGEFTFNLADLNPHVGDVVTFSFRAADALGQQTTSELLRVLISPNAVGVKAIGRAAELKRASQLASAWAASVLKAKNALDAARGGDPRSPKTEGWSKAGRLLLEAGEAASVLRQGLLRSIARSDSPALCTALARLVDDTAIQLIEPGRLLTPGARTDEPLVQKLNAAVGRSSELAAHLEILAVGERSQLALAELNNLKAADGAPPLQRMAATLRNRAVEHARQARDDLLRGLSLQPNAGDLESKLQQLIARERDWLSSQRPVEFWPAAQDWAQRLRQSSGGTSELVARLLAAGDAEAVRPDADLVVARDLQLAGRAAAALAASLAQRREERVRGGKPPDATAAAQAYLQAFAALKRQHDPARNLDARPVENDSSAEARARLSVYTAQADAETPPGATPAPDGWSDEDLALDAAAESARRGYDRAAQRDIKLAEDLAKSSPEEASQFLEEIKSRSALASRIDQLILRQEQLRRDTEAARGKLAQNDTIATTLATAQQELADSLAPLARSGDAPSTQPTMENHEPIFTAPSPREAARNPLVAAAWQSRSATEGFNHSPHDINLILGAQQATIDQLRLSWRRVIALAAERRLKAVPSFAVIYLPSVAESTEAAGSQAFGSLLRGSRGRDWFRPMEFGGTDRDAALSPVRDTDTAGYREQLEAYFAAMARARNERGRK